MKGDNFGKKTTNSSIMRIMKNRKNCESRVGMKWNIKKQSRFRRKENTLVNNYYEIKRKYSPEMSKKKVNF